MLKTKETNKENEALIQEMFEVGAHFGYSKKRRHSSVKPFIFGIKNQTEIIDLEKTTEFLDEAKSFIEETAFKGGKILFVGTKPEAKDIIKKTAEEIDMPYVIERWIGGTITNFSEIKKRIAHLKDLIGKKEKGDLSIYTKKEQLLIEREMERLNRFFSGVLSLETKPAVIFVVDSKHEEIAVTEALKSGIPVVSLSGSDCNIKDIDYPILANDSSISSISFFVGQILDSYKKGQLKNQIQVKVEEKKEDKTN